MIVPITLSMTAEQHTKLRDMLFPGDNKETVAFALCGQCAGDRRHRLLIQMIYSLSDDAYVERQVDRLQWKTDQLVPILELADERGMTVVKFHSHPNGLSCFSEADIAGDKHLLPLMQGWLESTAPVGSAVMLPNGQIFGHALSCDELVPLDVVSVVGDDISLWYANTGTCNPYDFCASHEQLFGTGTTERLQRLSVAVIGCSGTGSSVVEQLALLGVKEIVLVDNDHIEERNVNRIYNSSMDDAKKARLKVDVLSDGINRAGLGTFVLSVSQNLLSVEAIKAVAQCDVVIGCMDSFDGRYLLNNLATFYTIPYFDVGVRLIAKKDGSSRGEIREVCGSVHYLQPGKSSMVSREVFTLDDVKADGLRRADPDAHACEREEGYISGVEEHRPAVISVNTTAASLLVNELLARLHPYREEENCHYSVVSFSLSSMEFFTDSEHDLLPCELLRGKVGIGDIEPPLEMWELSGGGGR